MNFNSRIAKIGKGKFVNAYKGSNDEIVIYLNNRGLVKKRLTDDENGFNLYPEEYASSSSEIIKLADDVYVERIQSSVKVKTSDI